LWDNLFVDKEMRMVVFDSQDWAISKIRNVRHLLWEIPDAALATYNCIPPALRLPFNPRITANVLNGYVIHEAQKRFDGVRGSEFFPANGTTYHLFNGCVLWYKQLGEDGLPSNYPTESAVEMMQGHFSFAPQRPILVLGFQVDEAMQSLTRVVIQRFRSTGRVKFYVELEKIVSRPRVVEMPVQTHDALATRTRIRIKRGPEDRELFAQENE
jgi:hypothetical protein